MGKISQMLCVETWGGFVWIVHDSGHRAACGDVVVRGCALGGGGLRWGSGGDGGGGGLALFMLRHSQHTDHQALLRIRFLVIKHSTPFMFSK